MSAARIKLRITRVIAPELLMAQVEPKMRNLMNAMGRRAQRLVPKRTWALHDTISVDTVVQGSKIVGTLGAGGGKVNYALFVERGTSRMAAQPYLRPALLQTTSRDFNTGGDIDPDHGAQQLAAADKRAARNAARRARYVGSANR